MFGRAAGAIVLLAGLLVLGGSGLATAAPTPVPDLKPDLSSMTFLIGTWKCVATVRGKSRPDTVTFSMGLDGRWIQSHDVAPPFDQYRTRPITTDAWLTYNQLNHLWVTVFVDDFGAYGVTTSPGWQGAAMTTIATVTNDGSSGHDTMTKLSDTSTKDVSVSVDKGGKQNPPVTTLCNKQ
jgi:hypothetical protein